MTVTPTLQNSKTLKLSRALLVYDTGASTSYGRSPIPEEALVTIHEIAPSPDPKGGAPELLPGRLLDRATFAEIWRSLSGLSRSRQILPPNILFYDAGRMIWYVPATRRRIWFSERYASLNKTIAQIRGDLNGREVLWPALLFAAEPGNLYVWALGSDDRPTEETPIFVAPCLNMYDTGHMCRGNVKLPDVLNPAGLNVWQDAFYGTEFTHSNYRGFKICAHPRGHDGLWRSLVWRQAWRGFPQSMLTPCLRNQKGPTLTVGDVISR